MWEERFDGIGRRFDQVDRRLDSVDGRFDGVDARLDQMDVRFDGIDGRLDSIDGRLGRMDARFDGIDGKLDELRTHMGVLHEDALARIAATAEDPPATRADIGRLVAKFDDLVDRRIVPLELTVRDLVRERNSRA